MTSPAVTVYRSRPAMTCARVLLPEPLGPMMACTSPAFTVRSIPRRISLPPAFACKFLICRIGFSTRLSNASLQADAQKFLCLNGKFHGQLAKDFLAEAVHDHADGVLG